jgi:hypothetical protein
VSGYDDNQSGEILHVTANQETFREKLTIKKLAHQFEVFRNATMWIQIRIRNLLPVGPGSSIVFPDPAPD